MHTPLRPAAPRPLAALLALVTMLAGLALVSAAPAVAVDVAPPTGLSPDNGVAVAGVPNLSWTRTAGVSRYDVQLMSSGGFANPLVSVQTSNSAYTPTINLPSGPISWRVRAAGASETSWATAAFVESAAGAPTPTGPTDDVLLDQPDSPPLLAWTDVPNARGYRVQISTDLNFADPSKIRTYTTDGATNLSLPDLQIPDRYYWQVQADLGNGITSAYSTPRSYRISGLTKPVLTGPRNDVNESIVDVVLDWEPVRGAAGYDLQISTDSNFLDGTIVDARNNIAGTRYSPPGTLNNDQYYWRVRPVDAAGNRLNFSDVSTWRFRRYWPSQPTLTFPADNSTVADPFFYQWTPVDHASLYFVQVSPNPQFTAPTVRSCTTTGTTLTRGSSRSQQDCFPASLEQLYWRVVARDEYSGTPPQTAFINAAVHSFTYDPGVVPLLTPSAGVTVKVPTLTWQPVAHADRYAVTITDVAGGGSLGVETAATTFTPESLTPGTYRWDVRTISRDGQRGSGYLPSSQRRFTVVAQDPATATSPEPNPVTPGFRFPTLTWTPTAGAVNYQVFIRPQGAIPWSTLPGTWTFPAADDRTSTFLPARTYQWYVEARTSDNSIVRGGTGTFTIRPLPQVTDTAYYAALTGTTLTGMDGTALDRCASVLPDECQDLRQMPVLGWSDPNPNVGYYELYISRDAELTNLVYDPIIVSANNVWTDVVQLPDSQAGSAYFWELRPCLTNGVCANLTAATHAFNKKSRKATLSTPANGAVVANDVTLTWDEYLDSEASTDSGTPLRTAATAGARSYRVQTATDPNFQNVIETRDVDQLTFTSFDTTYPEGPVYWRVQAYDGTNNALAWSDARMFQKSSPSPVLTSPASGVTVRGDQPLRWQSLPFAAGYQVEIYRNDDRVGQPANRVDLYSTRQIVLTINRPLEASTVPYTWRVRRVDSRGREGAWSALQPFTVAGPAPTLGAPAADATVDPANTVFTWSAQAAAASYRFERRPLGQNTTENVVTAALSWAPTDPIGGGDWEWRVSALDSAGRILGSSSWRVFHVVDTITAVVPVAISGNGRVGTQVTVAPTTPSWNLSNVVTTFQWRRNGSNIAGATGTSYVLTPADTGQDVTVAATGTRTGYRDGTSVSNAVRATPGTALSPLGAPSIRGNAIVRGVISADPGSWPGSPTFAYSWTRDGVAINGATGRDYTIVAADAGHLLAVRVTATANGYDPGTATSGAIKVAKQSSQATLAIPTPKISAKARAKVTVKVVVNGVVDPSGTVKVLDGAKQIATASLKPGGTGEVVVRLPKLKKGKHVITVQYAGNDSTDASTSAAKKVKVVAGKKK